MTLFSPKENRKNWAALGQFVLESTFNSLLHNSNRGGGREVRKALKSFQPGILNKEKYLEVVDGLKYLRGKELTAYVTTCQECSKLPITVHGP